MINRHHTSLAALAAFIGLAAAACSSSGGGGSFTIAKHDIETKATAALTRSVGIAPKSITCPSDLAGRKGASESCTLTAPNGDTLAVKVTVTKVSGTDYKLFFKVGTKVTHH
jgi:hypothetical protein